jgi:hypothetical protein
VASGEDNYNVKGLPEKYASQAEVEAVATAELERTRRSQPTLNHTLPVMDDPITKSRHLNCRDSG